MIDVEPEAVFEVAVDAFFGEPMRRSASICTDQHPMRDRVRVVADTVAGGPFGRELGECVGEHGDVIDGGVRPGIARPQLRREDFVGLGDDRQQRVMPVSAFVVRARVLLVGFGVDQRRVEVDDQIVTGGPRTRRPRRAVRTIPGSRCVRAASDREIAPEPCYSPAHRDTGPKLEIRGDRMLHRYTTLVGASGLALATANA